MSLPGYDAWLERPYQEAYAREEAYERYEDACHDLGAEATEAGFEDWLEDGTLPWPDEDRALLADEHPDPDRARDDWLEAQYEERYDDVPF